MSVLLRFRGDEELQQAAERIAREMGISLGDAIRLFLTQMVKRREIPFRVKAGSENDDILSPFKRRAKLLDSFYED